MIKKKIKDHCTKLIILFIICLFILPVTVNAEDYWVIFNHLDGVGDDYGSGNYRYPQNYIFQNKGHLFDLKSLTIFESAQKYRFRFSFSKLTDPWGAKYEFSLPLIELYFDNQSGGSNKPFHSGANISFKDDFYWDQFIKISGWWVKYFTPESKKENFLNLNELSFQDPNHIKNLKLERKGNNLWLELPKSEISLIDKTKIIVLVGSFDPFGYDHFRSLSKNKSYWQIYAGNNNSTELKTRVLDLLAPGFESQKKLLSGKMPELPYLELQTEFNREATIIDYLMPINKFSLSILFAYIMLLILVLYKFNYKR